MLLHQDSSNIRHEGRTHSDLLQPLIPHAVACCQSRLPNTTYQVQGGGGGGFPNGVRGEYTDSTCQKIRDSLRSRARSLGRYSPGLRTLRRPMATIRPRNTRIQTVRCKPNLLFLMKHLLRVRCRAESQSLDVDAARAHRWLGVRKPKLEAQGQGASSAW